jgi:vacuole morphology and inheritance protein 14
MQAYSLACELLAVMAQEPLSMRPETAVELSQLVSLLEAPAFAPLRLQLLQPAAHPALLRAAHGVLMLLPQGDAFRTLQTRLQSVPIMALLANKEQQPQRGGGGLDTAAFGGSSGSFSALDLNAGAEPPPASPTVRPRQSPQQQQPEVAQSPPQWQLVQQRAPLIEDKRLVQLFKSRVSRLP